MPVLYRGDINESYRKMVFFAVAGMMALLSISTVVSASTDKRQVTTENTTLADIREGLILLRNVANGSRVGMI